MYFFSSYDVKKVCMAKNNFDIKVLSISIIFLMIIVAFLSFSSCNKISQTLTSAVKAASAPPPRVEKFVNVSPLQSRTNSSTNTYITELIKNFIRLSGTYDPTTKMIEWHPSRTDIAAHFSTAAFPIDPKDLTNPNRYAMLQRLSCTDTDRYRYGNYDSMCATAQTLAESGYPTDCMLRVLHGNYQLKKMCMRVDSVSSGTITSPYAPLIAALRPCYIQVVGGEPIAVNPPAYSGGNTITTNVTGLSTTSQMEWSSERSSQEIITTTRLSDPKDTARRAMIILYYLDFHSPVEQLSLIHKSVNRTPSVLSAVYRPGANPSDLHQSVRNDAPTDPATVVKRLYVVTFIKATNQVIKATYRKFNDHSPDSFTISYSDQATEMPTFAEISSKLEEPYWSEIHGSHNIFCIPNYAKLAMAYGFNLNTHATELELNLTVADYTNSMGRLKDFASVSAPGTTR